VWLAGVSFYPTSWSAFYLEGKHSAQSDLGIAWTQYPDELGYGKRNDNSFTFGMRFWY